MNQHPADPSDSVSPVMECMLVARDEGDLVWPLAVRVWPASTSSTSEWEAKVEVTGLLTPPRTVYGVDSWQAMQLAIKLAVMTLTDFENRGGTLSWPPSGCETQGQAISAAELLPQV